MGFTVPEILRQVAETERGHSIMYVVCKDHLELAIDMFVDEYEDAPDIVDLQETHFSAWEKPKHCDRCLQEARFLVV
jgi:CxxH/CxxC protein (TIGR04129 family)